MTEESRESMELGVTEGVVRLAEHDPRWHGAAEAMIRRLREFLTGSDFLDFQHVGSTAINGIPAKPIVDIAVAIREPEAVARWRSVMEEHGFQYLRKVTEDDWMFYTGHPGQNDRTHHIHFVTAGSERWDRYIYFRDYLNAVPADAERYGSLKRALAVEMPSERRAYNAGKEDLILELEAKARRWRKENAIPDEILESGMKNLLVMSRTANGSVDVSSTPGKEKLMLVTGGNDAARAAARNFESALRYAWSIRNTPLESPGDVRRILEKIASEVNRGILREDCLYRQEDSGRHTYLPAKAIPDDLEWFCGELLRMLSRDPGDAVEEAAFTEFYVNFRGHYFSDGCGKTSMAAAAWVLMRRGHPLPGYRGGKEAFYRYEPDFVKGTRSAAEEEAVWKAFLEFYRTLF